MSSVNFTLAQERVLERRRQRAVEARSRLPDDPNTRLPPAVANLPYPLSLVPGRGLSLWDTLRGREGTRPAFRVGQVDAELLDKELLGLFQGQVGEGLKYFGRHAQEDWSHEIELALHAILFKLSIWDHNASYGAALQNLRYTDSRSPGPVHSNPTKWQKSLYGLLTVGGQYAWDKWEAWMIDQEGGYQEPSPTVNLLSRITKLVSTTHSLAAFISFLVFLANGRYRTLVDRLLRMRLAPPSTQVSRDVSFEYLNRQLVWHAFTEFLLFVLPLVGIGRWRRWVARAWRRTVSSLRSSDNHESEKEKEKDGELSFLPERTCAICYQAQNPTATSESAILGASSASGGIIGSARTDVTNPYETMPCGCVYCFVCIAEKLEVEDGGGEGWVCLKCGEIVKQCRPWGGDVLEEEGAPSSSSKGKKNVGFVEDGDSDGDGDGEDNGSGSDTVTDGSAVELGSNEWAREDTDNTSVEPESDYAK